MDKSFRLPGFSYEELVKIIRIYSQIELDRMITLHEISEEFGVPSATVSRNNVFLTAVRLINEGRCKSVSERCKQLGRAYEQEDTEEIEAIWKGIVAENKFLTEILSILSIKADMSKSEFVKHILSVSGSSNNNNSKTGAHTILEIFKNAKLLEEQDGRLTVRKIEGTKTLDSDCELKVNAENEKLSIKIEPIESNCNEPSWSKDEYYIQPDDRIKIVQTKRD